METNSLEERTFKEYVPSQAKAYADHRGAYHTKLYDKIIHHHTSTGGSLGILLDVGCGPGNSVRPLARHFEAAYGIDASPEMIKTARTIEADLKGAASTKGGPIEFIEGRAEDMAPFRDTGRKVDLVMAATAAHWFDMPRFWSSAAHVLKPGGTVALWTTASAFCHPSTPNAAQIQEKMFRLERERLGPYELPGNRLARDAYDDLPLPWTVKPPVEAFPQSGYARLDWDRDGVLSDPEGFFLGDDHVTLDQLEVRLSTASMVTRWREKHPDKVGTEEDIVKMMIQDLRELLGREEVIVGRSCHLLLFKRA